ncbi:class F sortase [Streptomyces sp. ICBB 8177]|nr:class F sortase [Streptomyces sp. ICBB 8177]
MVRNGLRESAPPRPAAVDAPTRPSPAASPGKGTGTGPGARTRPRASTSGTGGDGGGSGPADAAQLPPVHAPLPFSAPGRVRIPSIGVDAPVTRVGLEAGGWVGAPSPTDRNLTGWYTQGPAPGERGTAVIDGHVDTMAGPAVFYGLGALHRGNRVEVSRADGRTAVFTVYGVALYPKAGFPARRVYGDTGQPELRLITCGGDFTKERGYDSDVVVFARLTSVRAGDAEAATGVTGDDAQGRLGPPSAAVLSRIVPVR